MDLPSGNFLSFLVHRITAHQVIFSQYGDAAAEKQRPLCFRTILRQDQYPPISIRQSNNLHLYHPYYSMPRNLCWFSPGPCYTWYRPKSSFVYVYSAHRWCRYHSGSLPEQRACSFFEMLPGCLPRYLGNNHSISRLSVPHNSLSQKTCGISARSFIE